MDHTTEFTVAVEASRVKISGELDVLTSPAMIAAALRVPSAELDLSEVTFMDARGVSALLWLRGARPGVRIVAVSVQVKRVLDMTNTATQLLADSQAFAAA